jgi:type I restriction enzyme S subunit
MDARFLADLGLKPIIATKLPKVFAVAWDGFLRWGVRFNQLNQTGADISQARFPVAELGSLLELVQYGTSEKANTVGEGVPVIRMNNIVDGLFDLQDLKHVSLPEKATDCLLLQDGDILINRTNSQELVGKCAVFHESGDYVFASYLIRLRANPDLADPDFLAFVINSPIGRQQVDALSRKIIGQANINSEELRSLEIPLPPLPIQTQIMSRVAEGRAEIVREREVANRLEESIEAEIEGMILGTIPVPMGNSAECLES